MARMKSGTGGALFFGGALVLGAASVLAQEAAGEQAGTPGSNEKRCEMCTMREGKGREMEEKRQGAEGSKEMMARMRRMRRMHKQMDKHHQEMMAELQRQLTARRKHSQEMDRLTDEGQMLEAVKKHLRMTDALLETTRRASDERDKRSRTRPGSGQGRRQAV